jgi:BirA family biotin operon repressor/biotin-[acetyl-CoA-carboxylase] ligase
MQLPLTRAVAPSFELLDEVGSTNTELVARATAGAQHDGSPVPHFAALATTNQTAGRGRLGRAWVAPPGAALAVSVLLAQPNASLDQLGWVPLIAGLAMCRAVRGVLPGSDGDGPAVGLKWPNDVQVGGRKVSGILGEVVPGGAAVVIGAGLNLTMTQQQLPVPTATSLTLEGADAADLLDRALSSYLAELRILVDGFARDCFDAGLGVRAAVLAECATIGSMVRVERPGGDVVGRAIDIDADGRLVVDTGGAVVTCAAGDVIHLRPA